MENKFCTTCKIRPPRRAGSVNCAVCHKEYNRRWAQKNRVKHLATKKRYNSKHAEQQAWAMAHPSANNIACRAYRARNPDKRAALTHLRVRAEKRATPPWDQAGIRKLYLKAKAMGMTVDHIVPLRHPLVCGLHVHANLQLLVAAENSKKQNRFWPDMP